MEGADELHLGAGEILYGEGDQSDSLYLVLSGQLKRQEDGPAVVIQLGDLIGLLEVLSGEGRTCTVSVTQDAHLLRVTGASLVRLIQERPEVTERLVEVAERHLLRREVARLLPEVFGSLDADALSEMARVFRWSRLARGEALFAQGDPGDALYVLVSGRLRAQVMTASGTPRIVGEIAPGETVGEMSLVTNEARSATVVALRDSVLQVCDRADFDVLVDAHPQLSRHLATILVQRLKRANQRATRAHGRMSVALLPLHDGIDVGAFAQPLVKALEGFGDVLHLDRAGVQARVGHLQSNLGARLQDLRLLPWFEEQESRYDVVVYEAEAEPNSWTARCVGQADRIVLIADADHDPRPGELEDRIEQLLSDARPSIHLVLLQPADRIRPRGTADWLAQRQVDRHHHVRRGRLSDVERVARLLTGRGLGLVLSGGGARGFAHIGVLQVIEELGIPVDAIGGTSAGAGLAAQYAMGHSTDEIRDINWREFVVKRPFRRYTMPVYSLVSRTGVDRASRSIYGDLDIADLWIPYFCTSCDIHTGTKVLHRRGPLWKATRASTSLPGIVPPVVDGTRLLVDGGVLDNIPEEEMKDFCDGPVIAVDVSAGAPIPIDYDYDDLPSPWWVLWNRMNPFGRPKRIPGLLEVLVRTATVSNASQRSQVGEISDLVLRPPVAGYGLLDFGAIDRIIHDTVAYAKRPLAQWREGRGAGN